MTRFTAALFIVAALIGARPAFAQETTPAEGRVVVTIIPAGASFFTEGKNLNGPSFGNFDLGGSIAGNFNRFVGIEGEVLGKIGVTQSLGDVTGDVRTPHMIGYNANLVVSAPVGAVVPYISGGIGGLSFFETLPLGIGETTQFLTGNIGGGLKWYAGRWGLRGDYRFMAVRSKDDAPAFFGREHRYGHRIYGAFLINVR